MCDSHEKMARGTGNAYSLEGFQTVLGRMANCAQCDATLASGARFCHQCGAPSSARQTQDASAERRHLTVMFCDIVGSTALSQRLDPEALSEELARYHSICTKVIARYDGFVAQYLGDGILAYFGYPRAHEDDAERALRAALEVQAALGESRTVHAASGERIEARIGIHTGPVVVGRVGDGARREIAAIGITTNIAARVEAEAAPGTVVVTEATLRLVPGIFHVQDLGLRALKGVTRAIRLFEIQRQTGAPSRALSARSLAPLVGRASEARALLDCWTQVTQHFGQAVLVSGDAGVGKTRLVAEFRENLAAQQVTWLDTFCSPFAHGIAFQPIAELLGRGFGFDRITRPAERTALLERLDIGTLPAERVVPYLVALLELPNSARFPMPQISGALQRERTLEALTLLLLTLADLQPVVLCVEDLHWCDPSTLEVLGRMVRRIGEASAVLVLTARHEFVVPWADDTAAQIHRIALKRLTNDDARRLAEYTVGEHPLPAQVLDQLIQRADGVPLYLEELAKNVIEADADDPIAMGVPATLQDSLTARLDRLGDAKPIAQVGATLGREFEYAVIASLPEVAGETLDGGLSELVAAQILYRRGSPDRPSFLFKHALLQETAYESQLLSVRRRRHADIVEALEDKFSAIVTDQPERLALHCAEGGLRLKAARYFEAAGRRAVSRIANIEAIAYYRHGLTHLSAVPEDLEQHQLEIALRCGLGGPLGATKGHLAPEAVENFARVRELADLVGEGPQQIPAWIGLVTFYMTATSMRDIRDVGSAIIKSVAAFGERNAIYAMGSLLLGTAEACLGTMSRAVAFFEKVVEIGAAGLIPPPASVHQPDMIVLAKAAMGTLLFNMGDPARALSVQEAAIARARELDHANSLIVALLLKSLSHYFGDDPVGAKPFVDEGIALATRTDFRTHLGQLLVYRGWIRTSAADEAGVEDVTTGIDAYRSMGGVSTSAWIMTVGARVLCDVGRDDAALAMVDDVEHLLERNGELNFRSHIYLTRARVLRKRADRRAGATWLERSIDAARNAECALDELVAANILAEDLIEAGRFDDARRRLIEASERFMSGFDLPTVMRTKELISRLA